MNKKIINIAIDVSPLSDGNSTRGVGFYTKNLVSALQSEIKTNPDFRNFNIQLLTDKIVSSSRFDLIHYPFFDLFKQTLKPTSSTPFIVTVHDLIPIQFKKHFPVGIKGNINWLLQKHNLSKSKLIVTVSQYSKYIIHQLTNFPLDKIYVTYEAPSFSVPKFSSAKLLAVNKKYNLPKKYVLFVGDVNWNKNIPTLVKTCQKLKYPLVIAGKSAANPNTPVHPWTKDIIWLQKQAQNNPLIKLLGFVPDADLPYIYKSATVYCQPSFAEGFGLTPLEAMSCGCPVVYSQETSLWEMMDLNGLFFDPGNPADLAIQLKKLWTSEKLQKQFSKLGNLRAQQFNWKYTAIQTLTVYQLALLNNEK